MSTPPSTVNPEDMARFRKLAEYWWDPTGPFWPLHRLNGLRSGYIREQLSACFDPDTKGQSDKPLSGLRILDIGCGGGILSETMAALGAEVLGVDVVEKNIHIAENHARDKGLSLQYRLATAESLAKAGEVFDAVLNMEVVEHVDNLPLFMASCASMVRPGGVMIVATLNRTLKSYLFAILGAEYILGWLPRGTHQWHKFVTPSELQGFLQDGGLEVKDSTGVAVDPLRRKFSFSSSMAVNYMLTAHRAL